MSYIEVKWAGNEQYASFVKKIRIMGDTLRISRHIGKYVPTVNSRDYLRRNLESLTEREFELRAPYLEGLDMTYSDTVLPEIEHTAIRIDNLLEVRANRDAVMVEFAKEFIFNSNNIEGSRIPAKEVKRIIETGDSRYRNANEVREVYNSIDAMDYISRGFTFTLPSVKRLYYILTKDLLMSNGLPYPRGFKTMPNVVNNMETIPPDRVVPELTKLLDHYKKNRKRIHPLKLALDIHLGFEEIHPFHDGNGRTGRLIMNKVLMTNGYFPVVIHTDNSRAYFTAIAKASERRNVRTYYQFMLKQMLRTYKEFLVIIKEL